MYDDIQRARPAGQGSLIMPDARWLLAQSIAGKHREKGATPQTLSAQAGIVSWPTVLER